MLNFIFIFVMTKIKTCFGRGCSHIRLRMYYAHLFGGYLKSISYLFFFWHFLHKWVVKPCVYDLNNEILYVFKQSLSLRNFCRYFYIYLMISLPVSLIVISRLSLVSWETGIGWASITPRHLLLSSLPFSNNSCFDLSIASCVRIVY